MFYTRFFVGFAGSVPVISVDIHCVSVCEKAVLILDKVDM